MISSTVPIWSSKTTRSPTRSASLKASCIPANTFDRVDCAARPATMESSPAEANSDAPRVRSAGKVNSAHPRAMVQITAISSRAMTCIWVRTRRKREVSVTSSSRAPATMASSTALITPVPR